MDWLYCWVGDIIIHETKTWRLRCNFNWGRYPKHRHCYFYTPFCIETTASWLDHRHTGFRSDNDSVPIAFLLFVFEGKGSVCNQFMNFIEIHTSHRNKRFRNIFEFCSFSKHRRGVIAVPTNTPLRLETFNQKSSADSNSDAQTKTWIIIILVAEDFYPIKQYKQPI